MPHHVPPRATGVLGCTVTNNDVPAALTVTKIVVNDNGGSATSSSFTMTVSGSAVPGGSTSFAGSATGTVVSLNVGSYTVTNQGGDAPPTMQVWDDQVYLSRDKFLDPRAARYVGTVHHETGLAAGGSYTMNDKVKSVRGRAG